MAEKRLIDANALKVKAFADPDSGEGIVYVQDIDKAPTVDAVEVVRCHECKKWDQETWFCEEHSTFGHNGLEWDMFNPNDFCSYGERRTDG